MGKRLFATVAISAMHDRELTGLEWRLYAWVSLHDGMSLVKGKGAGCFASNLTLFAEVGCDYSAGCRALSKLVDRGHLQREQVGRSTRYRVIFRDPDDLQAGNISPPQQVAGTQDDAPEYVAEHSREAAENLSEPASDYSPLSGELDSVETGRLESMKWPHLADAALPASSLCIDLGAAKAGKTRSAEAGLSRKWSFTATLPRNFTNLPPGAQVARFEQAFASIGRDPKRLNSREREAFATWLGETAEAFWEEPHGQQAQRLHEEMMQW